MPPNSVGSAITAGHALAEMNSELANHEPVRASSTVLERLGLISPGQNVWDVNDALPEHLRMKHSSTRMSTVYKVLDPDRPAYTVVASNGGGMGMYHWDRRPTTNRERARLQSFSDDFVFHGGSTSVRRQIGMAVPPLAAKVVVGAVLDHLAGREYETTNPNLLEYVDPIHKARRLQARRKASRLRDKARAKAGNNSVESLRAS